MMDTEGAEKTRLIIFARYPRPGQAKTRLIPALGPEGTADLYRRMVEHTVFWARRLKSQTEAFVAVDYEGGEESLFQKWLGSDLLFQPQGPGDLGARMARSFERAFASGTERVILVGTDIPDLDERLAQKAFDALQENDLVLGPARDGGYYLIGLRRPLGQLFQNIPWGTGEVLAKTLQAAECLKVRFSLLGALDDVDRPEDMPIWENRRKENLPLISIIIPTLNEEENIAQCLRCTQNASGVERILVDGESRDRTLEIARSLGAKVITSPAGRGKQMNSGAQAAAGDLLLFLHADTRLPVGFADTARYTMALPGVIAGAFEFRLDVTSPGLRFIERVANWRSRHLQLPYGDQAIFTRSSLFREMGGFRDMPIMEDFEFVQRLKKRGRVHTVPLPAVTSARRWKELGTLRTTLINEAIVAAYYLGVSPARIRRYARRAER